jgi:uncharacterized protein
MSRSGHLERGPLLTPTSFFENPGGSNTTAVVRRVRSRLRRGDIDKLLVASESGSLALRIARVLHDVPIVCVTYAPSTRHVFKKPQLRKEELQLAGVRVVDSVPEPLTRGLTFRNWWAKKTVRLSGVNADLFWMTLIEVGGHGFRTAVGIVFMAVAAHRVHVGERVISIAGTGWGADSAIVMRASRFEDAVGPKPSRRMKIEEIVAMPKRTEWHGYG